MKNEFASLSSSMESPSLSRIYCKNNLIKSLEEVQQYRYITLLYMIILFHVNISSVYVKFSYNKIVDAPFYRNKKDTA